MNGTITSIQRFCLNDGDGIRTTVFLKGCNMRCAWCHNPEAIDGASTPMIYARKCIGCGHCFSACPTGARRQNFDKTLCVRCGACARACDSGALVMSANEVSVEDVLREAKQDALYYKYSSGGVTFSGGEALCQAKFVCECADALSREGIQSAVETNLYHPFAQIAPALSKMSLIMADIKLMDDDSHLRRTGVSNRLVLENAKRLGELGVPVIFRTPVIPGATDDMDNLRAIADYVSKIPNVKYYELLNYNPLGADKYTAMREDNPFRAVRPLPRARMEEIKQTLSGMNVCVCVS